MAAENDLGRDRISRLVLKIAFPSMMAQFVSVLYSIIDRIYVGNISGVGDLALAGVGISGPIVTMIGAVAFWVGVGGAPLMSIRMGEGNNKEARKILANGFLMLCVAAAAITVVLFPLRGAMLRLFGASEAIYPYAEKYFRIILLGTVFSLLATGLNQYVIGQGFAKAGMRATVLGAVTNIILDPVFIFGLRMGVGGAAVATVLSQAVSAACVLVFLLGKKAQVPLTFDGYELRLMKKIAVIGFTPFLIISMDNVMIITMNAVLQRYGGAQGDMLLTCNTILQSFMLVLTMPMSGISGGTQSILSFNFGARNGERVLKAERYICAMCAAFAGIMFVLARVAGPLFVRLFTDDPQISELTCQVMRISTLAVILLGFQYAIVDGFTAMCQMQLSLPLSFWRKLVYFVSIFILPALFGAKAAFYAEPISDVLGPLVTMVVYRLTIKKILAGRMKSDSTDGGLQSGSK